MVNFSDLLVVKPLHGLVWHHSVGSLIFMMSSIMFSLVTLIIEGVMSSLQLIDVKDIRKNMCFHSNKSYGKL